LAQDLQRGRGRELYNALAKNNLFALVAINSQLAIDFITHKLKLVLPIRHALNGVTQMSTFYLVLDREEVLSFRADFRDAATLIHGYMLGVPVSHFPFILIYDSKYSILGSSEDVNDAITHLSNGVF
jgi:hypothetical protein